MFYRRLLLVLTVLAVLILVVPACGGEDEETTSIPTSTSIMTATPTTTTTDITTPTSNEPVKIGAINSWSGPAAISGLVMADPAIKTIEKQVKDKGGILNGRELQIIKYDNRASVAEAIAGAKKLYYDDKVSVLVFGGVSEAEFEAVSSFAQEQQILFVSLGGIKNIDEKKFSVNASVYSMLITSQGAEAAYKLFHPETAAQLAPEQADPRNRCQTRKEQLKDLGINTVYEAFVPIDTTDYTPYLTKIKYEKPDVLFFDGGVNEMYITIAKQVTELGGLGDIQVFAFPPAEGAKAMAGAQGWYLQTLWFVDDPYPTSVQFVNDFKEVNGSEPRATQIYYYDSLLIAIAAIELAGTTDRIAIAEAARSGDMIVDTPMGLGHFNTDGYSDLTYKIGLIQDKTIVPVDIPE